MILSKLTVSINISGKTSKNHQTNKGVLDMIKKQDLSRLISFTDAVVAVAITLLVIPLTDIFSNSKSTNIQSILVSRSFIIAFYNFMISFFVIYSFWDSHHRMFIGIKEISNKTAKLNMFWLFTIVLVPAATAINEATNKNFGVIIYCLILFLNSFLLQKIKMSIYKKYKIYNNSFLIRIIIVLIFVICFPSMGHQSLFLLLIPINKMFPKVFFD